MKESHASIPFSGLAALRKLFVASVGVIAMQLMFGSSSYALPVINITATPSALTVLEGSSFTINASFERSALLSSGVYKIISVSSTALFLQGDKSDAVINPLLSTPTDFTPGTTLLGSTGTFYHYTITGNTKNDGQSYNDGPGVWLIHTDVALQSNTENASVIHEHFTTPLYVTVADAPEPSTWALMGIGGLLVALRLKKSGIGSAVSV